MMVEKTDVLLCPDVGRVIIRFFSPGIEDRIERIIARILTLDDQTVATNLDLVMRRFATRHGQIHSVFLRHFEVVAPHLITDIPPSNERKLLIGAYFTSEYALESAALFNPSIVLHPDQSGLEPGSARFVLSLRATGEGHVSSLEFRQGIIDSDHRIEIDRPGRLVTGPDLIQNPTYKKKVYRTKLKELGFNNDVTQRVLAGLGEEFSLADLKEQVLSIRKPSLLHERELVDTLDGMVNLAEQNYEVRFACEHALAERVIFPRRGHERKAIEDARFVRFDEENCYYASFTAFDRNNFFPQLLKTEDFCNFRFITLNGEGVVNKGMALFPRKINGHYVMLSRQDGENIFIMYSDDIHFWREPEMIMKPSFPWAFVQLGNCGSPIETPEGWLVLTHGVGPMRRYCIGAVLLDLENPKKIIGRLKEPLLEPDENEREGYVPNVVYTCGAMVHGDKLVMPYAMSDYATRIALVDMAELIHRMKMT
jgi:predicted GH43/DUF377 family glycosyl hydrolase